MKETEPIRGFHINPETFKAGSCSAEKRCRFAKDNPKHYKSMDEAIKVAERLSRQHFGVSTGMTRGKFSSDRKNIPQKLQEMGIIKSADDLPKVNSRRELVEKWFNGNENTYAIVSKLVDPETKYKDTTVKSITKILKTDMKLSLVNLNTAPDKNVSHVDLIDESDFSIESLNKKGLKAF